MNQITVSGMRTFTAGSLYFTLTLVGVYLVALAACCFPNRDALKHASRVIWVRKFSNSFGKSNNRNVGADASESNRSYGARRGSWASWESSRSRRGIRFMMSRGEWLLGLLGIWEGHVGLTLVVLGSVSSSGGHSSTDCASWWQTLQIAIILVRFPTPLNLHLERISLTLLSPEKKPQSIIATLVFHFYSAVVVSAYCHTLHPHLFFQDTEDEEDDLFYSDSDSDSPLPYARSSSTRAVARYDFDPPYDNSNGMRRRASRSRTSTTAPPSYRSRERVYEAPLSDSEESSVADEGSDESFIKYEEDEDPEAARDGEVRQLRAERRREALEDMWRRREEEEAERARRPRGRQPEELFESEEDEGSEGDSESSGDERVEAWRGRERRLDAGRRENQNLLR